MGADRPSVTGAKRRAPAAARAARTALTCRLADAAGRRRMRFANSPAATMSTAAAHECRDGVVKRNCRLRANAYAVSPASSRGARHAVMLPGRLDANLPIGAAATSAACRTQCARHNGGVAKHKSGSRDPSHTIQHAAADRAVPAVAANHGGARGAVAWAQYQRDAVLSLESVPADAGLALHQPRATAAACPTDERRKRARCRQINPASANDIGPRSAVPAIAAAPAEASAASRAAVADKCCSGRHRNVPHDSQGVAPGATTASATASRRTETTNSTVSPGARGDILLTALQTPHIRGGICR